MTKPLGRSMTRTLPFNPGTRVNVATASNCAEVLEFRGTCRCRSGRPGVVAGRSDSLVGPVQSGGRLLPVRGNRLPFQGNTAQLLAGHLMLPPDLTMLPEAERPAVASALSKKPEDRWPSSRAFVKALSGHAADAAAPSSDSGQRVETPGLDSNGAPAAKEFPSPLTGIGSPATIPPPPHADPTVPRWPPRPARKRPAPPNEVRDPLVLLALCVPLGLLAVRLSRSRRGDPSVTPTSQRRQEPPPAVHEQAPSGGADEWRRWHRHLIAGQGSRPACPRARPKTAALPSPLPLPFVGVPTRHTPSKDR